MPTTTASLKPPADEPAHQPLHRLISVVFEPSVVAAPLVAILIYVRRHTFELDLGLVFLALFLLGGLLPAVYSLSLRHWGVISSLFYSRRQDRLYFFPMLLLVELGIFVFFTAVTTSLALQAAAFAAFVVSLGLAILTIWNKISYHLAGLGGVMTLAVALVGLPGFALLPVMVLVAYSRRRLGEHTWLEVTVGGVYGIVTAALAYTWYLANADRFEGTLAHSFPGNTLVSMAGLIA
jgi:membrane-associated phospholipid phosphatase